MRRILGLSIVAAFLMPAAAQATVWKQADTPVAQPAQAGATIYGGRSAGRDAFVLRRRGRTLDIVGVWVSGTCDNGDALTYSAPISFATQQPSALPEGANVASGNRLSRSGRFSATGAGTADYGTNVGQVTETITGRVGRRSASGTIDLTVVLVDRATQQPFTTCRTGVKRWRARSSPRRVFGGLTSFGHPVVLELRADRRRVRTVLIGWQADCEPPDTFGVPDELVNFPISRTGRWGDKFTGRFQIEGGAGERTFEYDLSGRIRGSTATGALAVKVTDRNPAGAVTSTCTRSRHRYVATSSRR